MKKFLLVCFSFVFVLSAWAQDRVVSGKVTSAEDGTALPGVNVLLKGTTVGTVTSADGEFKLNVPASGGTLVFSFIGFQTQEAAIGDRSVIDIGLATDVQQLNEVIVTAVGITREARTIGYSVATVKNDVLTQARVTNVAAALSGKVSGLQINQTDNGVNGQVRVVLRGNRSLLGNNQALVVLDGVQVSSDYINSINPNDIESTTILKGANAAALYGSSASNGVLIINTKTGRNTVPEITVSSTTQVESVSYIPKLQTRFGPNGGETLGSPGNYNIDPNFPYPYTSYENQNFGPEFNGATVPLGLQLADGSQQYTTYSPKYNDHLNFFNHATTQQTDISFSVGDKTSNYYVSAQDVRKKGTVPGDSYQRDAFRFNGMKEYGIFKIVYKLQYTSSLTDVNAPAPGTTATSTAYWAWFNVGMNVPLTTYKNWATDKFSSQSGWYDEFYANPYWLLANNRSKLNTQDFLGNLELSLQPTKWLNLLGRVGLQNRSYHNQLHNERISFDPAIVTPGSSRLSTPGTVPAGMSDNYLNQKTINADFLATFSKKFAQDLDVRLIAANNIYDNFANGSSISTNNLLPFNPTIYNVGYRNGNLSGGQYEQRQRRVSLYGDLTATWKFLTVHGSFRNDWTSLLAASNRSFHYPEVDIAFVFTDAIPGLKDNQVISFGKVTASWAKVGNVSLNPYQLQGVFSTSTAAGNQGAPFSAIGNVPVLYQSANVIDANLKPEFTTAKEIGLDMGFWEQKITAKAAYYQTNTTNQTVQFGTSLATGYAKALINTGEMLNKGLEFDLSVTPISTASGFKLTLGGNYTDVLDNKVLSIYTSPTGDVLNSIQVLDNRDFFNPNGTQGNSLNSYAIVGAQYPQLQTQDFYRDSQGRVIVDPISGNPSRNPVLQQFGQTNPKHRLGLWTQANFKGFNLNVLFDYRAGYVIYNQIGADVDFGGIGYRSAAAGRQPFIYPNSVIKNSDGTFTSPGTPNTNVTVAEGNSNFWTSIMRPVGANYVTSGAFWKLREIALGYQVPKEMLEKTKVIKAAKITLTGRNLFMWRPKSNQWTDPEFSGDNSNSVGTTTLFQNPPTRIYGVNLTLTF